MATVIGQTFTAPLRAAKKESVLMQARFVNTTADGVIDQTASTTSDPGLTFSRSGAGTYALAFPACPADAVLDIYFGVHTGTPNVFWARVSALSLTAGTATVITSVAAGGAAADNNSAGMQFHIKIVGVVRAGN